MTRVQAIPARTVALVWLDQTATHVNVLRLNSGVISAKVNFKALNDGSPLTRSTQILGVALMSLLELKRIVSFSSCEKTATSPQRLVFIKINR